MGEDISRKGLIIRVRRKHAVLRNRTREARASYAQQAKEESLNSNYQSIQADKRRLCRHSFNSPWEILREQVLAVTLRCIMRRNPYFWFSEMVPFGDDFCENVRIPRTPGGRLACQL